MAAALPALVLSALQQLGAPGGVLRLPSFGVAALEEDSWLAESPHPRRAASSYSTASAARLPGGEELLPPHSFGILMDPDVPKSNAGVLTRVRIEWTEDSAIDIERASRAFCTAPMQLYTDYAGQPWQVDTCEILPAGSGGTAGAPGTVMEVEEMGEGQSRVMVCTKDGKTVRLTGRFTGVHSQQQQQVAPPADAAAPTVIMPGEVFCSVTLVSSWLKIRGTDRLPGGMRYV